MNVFAAIPPPVSATSISTLPLWRGRADFKHSPAGMASRAFKKRFKKTC